MVGFHAFTSFLSLFGIEYESHFTTPNIGTNLLLLFGYLLFGVSIPLSIRYLCYNKIYKVIKEIP